MRRGPCLACRINRTIGMPATGLPTEAHHVQDAGRIRNQEESEHRYTYGLCRWHHNAWFPTDMTFSECEELWGPARHKNYRGFKVKYGDDMALLAIMDLTLEQP